MQKGILLYSGGLDSLLAAKLLLDQGIELIGLHFILPFFSPDVNPEEFVLSERARRIGLKLRFERCGKEYMEMAEHPPHGFGSNMNPCIDCKIFFLRRAAEIMTEEGAAFVSTGEVVGQRPMSQTKDMMNHILKQTGLEGRLLRPLSAKNLLPTIPEIEGIVDREKLLDISGRSRHRQMELAAEFGITDYASPAGGCLYTDPNVARRIKDLYAHHPGYEQLDVFLLSFGRHFRLNERVKFIVSRNEHETEQLEKYSAHADYFVRPDFAGPFIYIKGELAETDYPFLASIVTRYGSPGKNGSKCISVFDKKGESQTFEASDPASDDLLDSMRI